jgi:hypothetical protein
MALTANQLRKQVDLPTWEHLRFAPVVPTGGLSATCVADNSNFNDTSGRYLYYLINATNFWRYDTVADTYEQLASPLAAPLTASSMRFAGAQGYYGRVFAPTTWTVPSITSSQFRTGLPSGQAAVGYRVRIISGKGAGQERLITAVSDPIVLDYGSATAGAITSLTDTGKAFTPSFTASPATQNLNEYVGCNVRTTYGTGANQVRKILYHSATVITVSDANFFQNEPYSGGTFVTAPAAGTVYQIEYNTVTVDTAWDVVPDSTSRYVIQSGGIWLVSGAAATPFYTLQYYDVLHDMWYYKPANQNMMAAAPTEVSLERCTENSSIWFQSIAASGSTTTLVDSTANWTVNQWAGYELYIWTGTGRGQIVAITSNTATTLTFPTITTAPDATSRYQIVGFDGGKSTGSNAYNTIIDTSKAWTTDRWKNYAIRIVSGTGAGQSRAILTNSGTTLTTYRPWNILPDSTSVYVIQGDSDTMYISWGGVGQIFLLNTGNVETLSHSRVYDQGIACVGAALLSDSAHTIYEQMPIAIASMTGTTPVTATTVQPHNLKVGQYVSIRGVTSSATDQYNVAGLVQITAVPSNTTFIYVPLATGSGTYTLGLTALSTTALTDASKDYRDNVSSGTNTSITFGRITPTNINGWYASGTNITSGARVTSGAGTTTVNLSTGAAVPSGVVTFSPWGPTTAITGAYSSGGATGNATVTLTAATPAFINGWYVSGTNIPINTKVFSGQGTTTITLTNAVAGQVAGTLTFYPPEVAGRMVVLNTAAPTITTGSTTQTAGFITATPATSAGITTVTMTIPAAAVSRYVITGLELLGAGVDGQVTSYYSGVLLGTQTTATAVDTNSFWSGVATATQATVGSTTLALSIAAPGSVNGWYITGAGIPLGAQIVSGAGTTTITISSPITAALSATAIVCSAWFQTATATNNPLVGRRLKFTSSTGVGQDVAITAVTATSGTITFGAATAGATGTTVYSVYSIPAHGAGNEINWAYGTSNATTRGKYLWMPRCGGVAGIDKLDLTTDKVLLNYYVPFAETLTTGTYFAYDGQDRLYFTKDATLRLYYIDVNTQTVHGAGQAPYTAGTAQIGNKMEIFTTADGLKFLFFHRHANLEHYRQMLFY